MASFISWIKSIFTSSRESLQLDYSQLSWNNYLEGIRDDLEKSSEAAADFMADLRNRRDYILRYDNLGADAKSSSSGGSAGNETATFTAGYEARLRSFLEGFRPENYYELFRNDGFNEAKFDDFVNLISEWKEQETADFKDVLIHFEAYLCAYGTLRKSIGHVEVANEAVENLNKVFDAVNDYRKLVDLSLKLNADVSALNLKHRFQWALVALIPVMLFSFWMGQLKVVKEPLDDQVKYMLIEVAKDVRSTEERLSEIPSIYDEKLKLAQSELLETMDEKIRSSNSQISSLGKEVADLNSWVGPPEKPANHDEKSSQYWRNLFGKGNEEEAPAYDVSEDSEDGATDGDTAIAPDEAPYVPHRFKVEAEIPAAPASDTPQVTATAPAVKGEAGPSPGPKNVTDAVAMLVKRMDDMEKKQNEFTNLVVENLETLSQQNDELAEELTGGTSHD